MWETETHEQQITRRTLLFHKHVAVTVAVAVTVTVGYHVRSLRLSIGYHQTSTSNALTF